jgi:hypothetical protein
MDFVERAVLRLREQPGFSRNRHFQAFSSPEGRRALRIHRHLRSLEQAVEAAGTAVEVERDGERVRITLTGPRFRRVSWLSAGEFRLLCTSPLVRAALGEAAEQG